MAGEFAERRQDRAGFAEREARQPQPVAGPAAKHVGGMKMAGKRIACAGTGAGSPIAVSQREGTDVEGTQDPLDGQAGR